MAGDYLYGGGTFEVANDITEITMVAPAVLDKLEVYYSRIGIIKQLGHFSNYRGGH